MTRTGPVYLGPLPSHHGSHSPTRGEGTESNPECNCDSRRLGVRATLHVRNHDADD
jgi:hypothetical protein